MHFWGQENKASVKDNNDQEPFDTVGKLLKDEIDPQFYSMWIFYPEDSGGLRTEVIGWAS